MKRFWILAVAVALFTTACSSSSTSDVIQGVDRPTTTNENGDISTSDTTITDPALTPSTVVPPAGSDLGDGPGPGDPVEPPGDAPPRTDTDPNNPEPDPPPVTLPNVEVDGPLTLIIDGWSAASMDLDALRFVYGNQIVPVELQPLSALDLARVAERDADALERLVARVATSDPQLRCDAAGCATANGVVELTDIASPTQLNGLGISYDGWGIEHGAWGAVLPALNGELLYGDSRLTLIGLAAGFDFEGNPDPEAAVTIDTVRTVGFAFGHLFELEPAWLDGNNPFIYYRGEPQGDANSTLTAVFMNDPALFGRGLGTSVDESRLLSPSQLTFRTSPTTGCGTGVLCVPGVADVDIDYDPTSIIGVCVDGEAAGQIVLSRFTLDYTYPAPTHQFGMWNGRQGDGTTDFGPVPLWASPPPLVDEGAPSQHAVAFWISGSQLVDFAGRATQPGVDDPDALAYVLNINDIPRLYGDTVAAC